MFVGESQSSHLVQFNLNELRGSAVQVQESGVIAMMRPSVKSISRKPVQFEKHEPERRHGGGGHVYCGCCCCCCCLHSVGGLIGGAAATAKCRWPSDVSSLWCYWISLVVLIAGVVLFSSASDGGGMGVIGALILTPFLQLGASVVTLIWIGIRGAAPGDKAAQLQILGWITLWSFLGAAVGVALMLLMLGAH
jgi:hypothetical protein